MYKFFGKREQQKIGWKFGTGNLKRLLRSGLLKKVAKNLAKHRLDLVWAQEVEGEKKGTKRVEKFTFHLKIK